MTWSVVQTPKWAIEQNLDAYNRKCFWCDQKGHISQYCPQRSNWIAEALTSSSPSNNAVVATATISSNKALTADQKAEIFLTQLYNKSNDVHTHFANIMFNKKEDFPCAWCPWLAGAKALKISMYSSKYQSMWIPVLFKSAHTTAEWEVLANSGATNNFINSQLLKWLQISYLPVENPIKIWNIDGTLNQDGNITHYTDLQVQTGQETQILQFLITNLGKMKSSWDIHGSLLLNQKYDGEKQH